MDPIELYEYVFYKIVGYLLLLSGYDLVHKKTIFWVYVGISIAVLSLFGELYTIVFYDYEFKLQSMTVLFLTVQVCFFN